MQVSVTEKPGEIRRFFSSPRVWLLLLLLLAWGLRLYHLDSMSLWWDESLSWDRAANSLADILTNTIYIQNIATRDLHPPLYFLFLHFSVQLFGATEFGLRVFSSIVNLLTLALMYPLARVLLGKRGKMVGIFTVLLATLSPFYVWYSQEARPYALVLLWSTFAVYALLRWLKTAPFTWRSRWAILFALAVGLTLATHYLSFVLLPFFAATLVLFDPHGVSPRARVRSPQTWLAMILLAAFAGILFLLPRGAEDLNSWDQAGPRFVPFFIMLRDVWNSFAVGLSANLDQVALLDLFMLALWLVGIFSTLRVPSRDARLALFLLCYLFVPAIAIQLGSYLRPLYFNSRHLIATSPAFYFGLALGVDAIARRLTNDGRQTTGTIRQSVLHHSSPVLYLIVAFLVALPLLAGALYSLNNLYFDATYAKDDHKAWSQFLRERLRPDDYLLLVAPQAEKIVEYYAPKELKWESLPHLGQTRDWQQFLDREAVLNAYRNHGRVWFLEIHQPVGDPKRVINNLLHRYGDPVDIVYFPAIASRIILQQFVYRGVEQKPDVKIAAPAQITFDENLDLLGYDAPRHIEAGGRAAVKLYWRLREKTPNDLAVSLRVVDAQGNVWGQWDAPPVGNLYPTSRWDAETIYLDQHDAVVDVGAPPGEYFVEASVYRTAGHAPLNATLADGTETDAPVRLTSLQVTRPLSPREPQTLVIDHHADVPFGDALRFVGYDADKAGTTPGSVIPLTLYFQVAQAPNADVSGTLALAAPWWQLWNGTQSSTSFTLALAQRQPGDIVQARVAARVPGDANAGTYELRLMLDGLTPRSGLLPVNALTIGAAQVDALARSTDLPAIAHPMNARLGEGVEFLGYDLDAAQPLKPGDPVKLKLFWRGRKPMDTSYTVFTHLINADQKIFGQQDKKPLDGARPTTSWAPGEVFSDSYEFEVAPDAAPGLYKLEIGMYNSADLVRLPTFDANDRPTGDRILFEELHVE